MVHDPKDPEDSLPKYIDDLQSSAKHQVLVCHARDEDSTVAWKTLVTHFAVRFMHVQPSPESALGCCGWRAHEFVNVGTKRNCDPPGRNSVDCSKPRGTEQHFGVLSARHQLRSCYYLRARWYCWWWCCCCGRPFLISSYHPCCSLQVLLR